MQPEDMDNVVAEDGIFLKELIRAIKNKDQVRAQALLRSLSSGKYKQASNDAYSRRISTAINPIGYAVQSDIMDPGQGRNKGRGKIPLADINFENYASGYDQPSPKAGVGKATGGQKVTPLKRAALMYALGDTISDWPEKTAYEIYPSDERRARLYRMKTQGAFAPVPGQTEGLHVIRGIRQKEDIFQPRVEKGRFGRQVQFNPESLKQDLVKMAAGRGLNVATRQMLPPQARVAVEAGLLVDDFLRSVTGKGLSDVYNEAKERFTESDAYYAVP